MLDKKVAIVSGAARGIGFGIAKQLAEEGKAIAILDIIDKNEVEDNIKELEERDVPVLYYQGDLSSVVDRENFCSKVMKEFGRIDILVNNAGVAPRERRSEEHTSELQSRPHLV